MSVRLEEDADREAIRTVHTKSFPTPSEAQLVDALRESGRLWISLVAEEDGEIVGHVAFSPVSVSGVPQDGGGDGGGGAGRGVGLGPVATLPDYRKRGIAEALILAGLARCKQRGHGFVVVLGDPAYYKRFGFEPARKANLSDEYDGGDAFQVLELKPGAIPPAGGRVQYAPEFTTVGEA